MNHVLRWIASAILLLAVVGMFAKDARAGGPGDAIIQYNLGLAEQAAGNTEVAYKLFKKACMASDGIADACMAWGLMAVEKESTKDMKRAFGSAVMLAPEDISARMELAEMLLKKEDWTWAIEHLTEALPHVENKFDGALLRYYLGYAEFKNGDLEPAAKHLAQADANLPPELSQKACFYRGVIAREQDKVDKAVILMERAQEGPEDKISEAARSKVESWSAFNRLVGWNAQTIFSFGYNSHPIADFLDNPGSESTSVLQSEFRGDLLVGSDTGYADGFFGGVTIYRQQNWKSLDDEKPAWMYSATDMDFTMLLFQSAYIGHRRKWGLEHQFKLGFDADLQFLDRAPTFDESRGAYVPSDDVLPLLARTLAFKIWWTMARDPSSLWSMRLRLDVLENQLTEDMSAFRTRLRLQHTRFFLDRTWQLKVLLGGRYDRTYHNPEIIKYDRLRPEAWLDLKWTTPWKKLSFLAGGKFIYNWYMNSSTDADNSGNSFRPPFEVPAYPNGDHLYSELENQQHEADYYMLVRHDLEWEVLLEAHLRLWKQATLALKYKHHQRASTIDGAPVPRRWDAEEGRYVNVEGASTYGYHQDLIMLELKQMF